jgi:hypothetical protein
MRHHQAFAKPPGEQQWVLDLSKPYFTAMATKYNESFAQDAKKAKPRTYYELKLGGLRPPCFLHFCTDLSHTRLSKRDTYS